MRACPECFTTYRDEVEFCFRDGAVLTRVELDSWEPPERELSEYKRLLSMDPGSSANFFMACLKDPLEGSDTVVLKVLSPLYANERANRARFMERYQMGASFRDPDFPAVLSVGTCEEDNTVFAALELVEGRSLLELLQRAEALEQPFPPDVALALGAELADVMDRFHHQNVNPRPVHGSLSPEEIMVLPDGTTLILNFGSAVPLDPFGESPVHRYAYAAPEQLRSEPVSSRTDIYTLALIVYSLIEGRNPHTRDDSSATMLSALTEDITLRPPYERLLGGALADDRADRPRSASALAEILRAPLGKKTIGEILSRRREFIASLFTR